METTSIKFNLVKTLLIIEQNDMLTGIFRTHYKESIIDLCKLAKAGKLNEKTVAKIEGIFLGCICDDEKMAYKYKVVKVPSNLKVEDIDVLEIVEEAVEVEPTPEVETVIESMDEILKSIEDETLTDAQLVAKIKGFRGVKTAALKLPRKPADATGIILDTKRPSCSDVHVKAIKQQFYTENDRLLLRGLQLNNVYCSIQAKAAKQKFTDSEAKAIKSAIDTLNRLVDPILKENTKNLRKK